MAKNRINIIISATDKGVRKVFGKITKGLGSIKNTVFSLKGLLAGAGLAFLGKSFIDAASTTENFQTRLKVLLGSAEKGNELFKNMADYAGRVPFEYEKVMASATALAGVMKGGIKEIGEWMPMIGDLAAASGLGIQEATEQVIRMYSAGAGAADLFRERGILAMLGFEAGVSYSAEETRKKLVDAWNDPKSKFKGATEEMADDWDGLMSMLKDAWFSFRVMVMESGPFQVIKDVVKGLLDDINKLKKSGEFGNIAEKFGGKIIAGITTGLKALPGIVRGAINAVEMLFLAVSGWKQASKLFSVLFGQVKIWSLEFINNLRLTFIRLMSGLPGDRSDTIKATYNDIGETNGRLDELEEKLEGSKLALGKIQVAQDETSAKFEELADRAESAMTRVSDIAITAAENSQGIGDKTKAGVDKSVSQLDRLIGKYDQLLEKQKLVSMAAGSIDPNSVDGFSYGDINRQIDQADDTQ